MLDSDIHDLSDDSDYAASQQQGSASVMVHSDSTKESFSSGDAAEIVFSKVNVTIHPTQFAIGGRLKLIKQGASLFLFDNLSLVWGKPRQPTLGSEEWITFLDSEGRVTDSEALRKRIFYGGLDHKLRNEVCE